MPRSRRWFRLIVLTGIGAVAALCGSAWIYFGQPGAGSGTTVPEEPTASAVPPAPPPSPLLSAAAPPKSVIPENSPSLGPADPTPEKAVPAVAPPAQPAPSAASEPMIALLLQRGSAALADGDIVGARMLFARASDLGSASAATFVGETYDPEFLARSGARGIAPDQAAAQTWFRKAAALGDPEARARLARNEGPNHP
jgi:hypothetical protein